MSFASPIVLTDAAAASENFLRIFSDNSTVFYTDEESSLSEPISLTIGHQMTKSSTGSDRHMVKLQTTLRDTDGNAHTLTCNCTLTVPRSTIARTDVDDAIARLKSFLVAANVDALLRGEL